jgi:hypothetical protein
MGIPNVQPQVACSIVEGSSQGITGTGGSSVTVYAALAANSSGASTLTFADSTDNNSSNLFTPYVNKSNVMIKRAYTDPVTSETTWIVNPTEIYAINAVTPYSPATLTSAAIPASITLDHPTILPTALNDLICVYRDVQYFVRYTLTDRNGAIAAGRSSGSSMFQVRLTGTSLLAPTVYIKAFIPLNTASINVDYSLLNIDLYRRNDYIQIATGATVPVFYKIYTQTISTEAALIAPSTNGDSGCYFDFIDTTLLDSSVSTTYDPLHDPTSGGYGETREQPLFAQSITSFNNQLSLANLTGKTKIELVFAGIFESTDLSGKSFTINETVFQFASTDTPIVPSGAISLGTTTTIPLASTSGYSVGDYIYICQLIFINHPLTTFLH